MRSKKLLVVLLSVWLLSEVKLLYLSKMVISKEYLERMDGHQLKINLANCHLLRHSVSFANNFSQFTFKIDPNQ